MRKDHFTPTGPSAPEKPARYFSPEHRASISIGLRKAWETTRRKWPTFKPTLEFLDGHAALELPFRGTRVRVKFDTADIPLVCGYPGSWVVAWSKSTKSHYVFGFLDGPHLSMHRLIMHPPKDMQVDHIDHDTLDNRRSSLRIVTRSQNLRNRRSGAAVGAYKCRNSSGWYAMLRYDGSRHYLGRGRTKEEALILVDRFRESHSDGTCQPETRLRRA